MLRPTSVKSKKSMIWFDAVGLKGVKINKDETFADGFRVGYESIVGNSGAVPAIPAHSIPEGRALTCGASRVV
jgi:hypothetical protein